MSFKKAQIILNEEDGQVYLQEVGKDTIETFNLSEELESFVGPGRLVDVTIRENFTLDGMLE